jgi:hypothetical protein
MMAASSITTPRPVKQKLEATNQASHVSNFTDSSAWQYAREATPLCMPHGGTEKTRNRRQFSLVRVATEPLCLIHKADCPSLRHVTEKLDTRS